MPHITIECSANIGRDHDLNALVRAVHRAALAHPLASPEALRTRLAIRDYYQVGPGGRDDFGFVAIAVRVGPGRADVTKTSFIEAVLAAAIEHVESTEPTEPTEPTESASAIMWSIELVEIDPAMRINDNRVRPVLAAEAAGHDNHDNHDDDGGGVDRIMPVRTRLADDDPTG